MQVGDKVIWADDMSDEKSVHEGTITKLTKEYCWVDNKHKQEQTMYLMYMWPIAAKEKLIAILIERRMLKKQYDDSMSLIYQLRNAVTRGEIK